MAREDLLSRTFVELADTLVDGYDPIEFLDRLAGRCVTVLGLDAAGVVLADSHGQLRAMASSSERMHLIELIEVQRQDGPCLDCWRTGDVTRAHDLNEARERWPYFAPAALDAGFGSAYAVPMRLRDERLGALNLLANKSHGLVDADENIAQAMADVATIGLLHERFLREREAVTEQLQVALNSRVVLEQAKGVVAEATGVDMDVAFEQLRTFARRSNLLLSEVARQVVGRSLRIEDGAIAPASPRDHPPR